MWHHHHKLKGSWEVPRDPLPTAYHEAGHALMAWRNGIPLDSITVFPWAKTGDLGVCRFDFDSWSPTGIDPDARSRRRVEGYVMTLFAGPEAERRLTDLDEIASYSMESASDMDKATGLCESMSRTANEAAAYAAWLQERTKSLLEEPWNWRPITALAKYLLGHHTVKAPQIRAIFRAETAGQSS